MVKVGETLLDLSHKEDFPPFGGVCYVSEPVVTVVVEPADPRQISDLLVALEKMASEDPNLHVIIQKETGEYLLSGMGELHLEIAANQLKRDFGLDVAVSAPRVVYMESVTQQGIIARVKSSNKQQQLYSFSVQVEPDVESQKLTHGEMAKLLYFDANGNLLVDVSAKTQYVSGEVLKSIIGGFEYACRAGPLCGEPVRQTKVKIVDLQLDPNQIELKEIAHGMSKAIFASFLTASPVLFEPVYATTISVSSDFARECSRILMAHRGKIKSFEQQSLLSVFKGFMPVSETFGFSTGLRSATSGRAIWQSLFSHWEKLPQKLAVQTIVELRKRKGLAVDVPKPGKFTGVGPDEA
jgi:elongation factor 2